MVEAEERFSFAFLKLYEKIRAEEISNLTNLHGYFITTCKNNFLMCVSRNKVRYSDSIPDYTYYEKDDQYELQNIKDVATNLIQNLPNKLKTISEKIYLEDKDHKEIAEELGIKYDNVRKYQYKSIQKLKQNVPKHLKNYLEVA